MTKRRKMALSAVCLLLLAALLVCALFYTGVWQFNHPAQAVRGVDVSHYQGEIDWPVLASQDIQFAFIKATEGSAYQDVYFQTGEGFCKQVLNPVGLLCCHGVGYIQQVPRAQFLILQMSDDAVHCP